MRDYKDDVIETLSDELHVMTERAVSAEADRDAYRLVVRQLLQILHIAITNPHDWVRRDRAAVTQITRDLIAELFTLERREEHAA